MLCTCVWFWAATGYAVYMWFWAHRRLEEANILLIKMNIDWRWGKVKLSKHNDAQTMTQTNLEAFKQPVRQLKHVQVIGSQRWHMGVNGRRWFAHSPWQTLRAKGSG